MLNLSNVGDRNEGKDYFLRTVVGGFPEDGAIDLAQVSAACHGHCAFQFGTQDVDDVADAIRAGDAQAVEVRPPDQYSRRAVSQPFQHVGTPANSAERGDRRGAFATSPIAPSIAGRASGAL